MTKLESNIWNQISLLDYEGHMSHETVGQLQLLNDLTCRYLKAFSPRVLLFLGIAGGNGLEHVDTATALSVLGIDINRQFLEETAARFSKKIPQLQLIHADINESQEKFAEADFVWAALVMEYTDLFNSFLFISNNTCVNAKVVITLQSSNGKGAVSETGFSSVKLAGQLFRHVDEQELLVAASGRGFSLLSGEINFLPNGKSFLTFAFEKGESPECKRP